MVRLASVETAGKGERISGMWPSGSEESLGVLDTLSVAQAAVPDGRNLPYSELGVPVIGWVMRTTPSGIAFLSLEDVEGNRYFEESRRAGAIETKNEIGSGLSLPNGFVLDRSYVITSEGSSGYFNNQVGLHASKNLGRRILPFGKRAKASYGTRTGTESRSIEYMSYSMGDRAVTVMPNFDSYFGDCSSVTVKSENGAVSFVFGHNKTMGEPGQEFRRVEITGKGDEAGSSRTYVDSKTPESAALCKTYLGQDLNGSLLDEVATFDSLYSAAVRGEVIRPFPVLK